jgi:hypothetical protein
MALLGRRLALCGAIGQEAVELRAWDAVPGALGQAQRLLQEPMTLRPFWPSGEHARAQAKLAVHRAQLAVELGGPTPAPGPRGSPSPPVRSHC